MATHIVRDYLGHPCQTTEAFEVFRENVRTAHESAQRDQRNLARDIGRGLLDLRGMIDHISNLFAACKELAPQDTDLDPLAALLEAGERYGIECSNRYGDLAGLMLLALERGHLFERQQVAEQSHG